jgi:hypothetical protein
MKKVLLIAVAVVTMGLYSNNASAQGISVELDFGYNAPSGDFGDIYDGGIGIALHPRLKLNDKMAVGLSIGSNGFIGGDLSGGVNTSIEAAGILAVMGTVQYKLLDSKITPYGEFGIGMFNGEIITGDPLNGATAEKVSSFGFAPEIGVMVGFLNASVTYAMAGDITYTQFGLGFRFGAK